MEVRLIGKAVKGDRNALERLTALHYQGVRRFLLGLTRNEQDAEDLTQNVFVKVGSTIDQWRQSGSFRSWLFRVAYREFLHWRRDRRDDHVAFEDDMPSAVALPEDALTLLGAIQELEEPYRAAFWLRVVERLSVKEAADALGVPTGTVKSRTHVAKQTLRATLNGLWTAPHSETNHAVCHALSKSALGAEIDRDEPCA